jgi:hypothetical protein
VVHPPPTRDPARDGSDFTENDTVSWKRPRRPGSRSLERKTIKAHALAHIARSARRSGSSRPERPAALLEEPTVVASAADHPELAQVLAGEIAAAAMQSRTAAAAVQPRTAAAARLPRTARAAMRLRSARASMQPRSAKAEEVDPAARVVPAVPAPRAEAAAARPAASPALAAALAPLVVAPVKRAPLPLPSPSTASGRASIERSRRSARASVRAPVRRRRLPLAALVIFMLSWAAVYQQAWSALSMSDRCRAVWEALSLAPLDAGPSPVQVG